MEFESKSSSDKRPISEFLASAIHASSKIIVLWLFQIKVPSEIKNFAPSAGSMAARPDLEQVITPWLINAKVEIQSRVFESRVTTRSPGCIPIFLNLRANWRTRTFSCS